jgi:hypothetical protein
MRNLMRLIVTVVLAGGTAAYASDSTSGSDVDATVVHARQVQAELNRGKNYADAWGTTTAGLDVRERAMQHQQAMNAGKDHTDARPMSTGDSDAVMANARLHQQAMERGLDHEDARSASHAKR